MFTPTPWQPWCPHAPVTVLHRRAGKLSLGSLDPGEGGLFSVGTLWGLFIVGLILFFVYSIVEQVRPAGRARPGGV